MQRLFHFSDPEDYRRVRDVLDTAGYADEGIVKLLGSNPETFGYKKVAVMLHRTGGGSPLETLIRLFILDRAVPLSDADRALAPMTARRWAELGLLAITDSQVQATVQLRCYRDLIVAFDYLHRGPGGVPPDYVMGISPSTLSLAGTTPRRSGKAALDLGTGCGFQAFMAADHMDEVVATDLNERAIEMARFNVGLNNLSNVKCVTGDMFAPVQGRKFDLIVSNPPFIIAPERTHLFLHGGQGPKADDVCRQLAAEAPRFLEQDGIAQFQINWAIVSGEDPAGRLSRWFEGSGCDVLVLDRGDHTPEEYAEIWIEIEGREPDEFAHAFERWMSFYRAEAIVGIGAGMVTMRRRDGDNWMRIIKAPERMGFPCGDDILRTLEACGFLEGLSDEDLMTASYRVSPDVRLEQRQRPASSGWELEGAMIRRLQGLRYEGSIDGLGAHILVSCDGSRSLKTILEEIVGAADLSLDEVVPTAAPIVRRLLEQGFLLHADDR